MATAIFTPCQSFSEQSVRVLIIDDTTGENGGILPNDVARKLVGDCYGKINRSLATEVTGVPDTPFQFRLGTKPQAEDDYYRIAKGTLAPANLDNPVGELQAVARYDLILATSSFKGRKDESAIQPGEYNLTIGLGIKTLAEYGEHSLGTQVLVNYPRGVEADILPQLARQAENLAEIQSDPRQLAAYYVEKYERRQALMAQENEEETGDDPDELLGTLDEVTQTAADEQSPPTKEDGLLYRLLKADLEGHLQILEHPKVTADLASFVRREWADIATGRAIKFQAGLAQPSYNLGKNEICVPYLPEGEELIVTRSPLINSNGVIILTNKHQGRQWAGEKVPIAIATETDPAHPNFGRRLIIADGEKLAPFSSESPQLPVGTTAIASITSPPGAAVIATTPKGNTLKITQAQKHDYQGKHWEGESTLITIGFKDNSNPHKPKTPVALVDGFVLGVIDSESFQTLKQRLQSVGKQLSGFIATARAVRTLGVGQAPSHRVDTQTGRVAWRTDF
jgi:hypothetical protein